MDNEEINEKIPNYKKYIDILKYCEICKTHYKYFNSSHHFRSQKHLRCEQIRNEYL